MNAPVPLTTAEASHILASALATEFEGETVELGENWELLANIFYKFGYTAASLAQSNKEI